MIRYLLGLTQKTRGERRLKLINKHYLPQQNWIEDFNYRFDCWRKIFQRHRLQWKKWSKNLKQRIWQSCMSVKQQLIELIMKGSDLNKNYIAFKCTENGQRLIFNYFNTLTLCTMIAFPDFCINSFREVKTLVISSSNFSRSFSSSNLNYQVF